MPKQNFADFSAASRKTVLSAKVSKILNQAGHGKELESSAQETLERGSILLSEILQGSRLIEKKPLEQGLRADLEAYGHALRSLPVPQQVPPSQIFEGYLETLQRVSQKEVVEPGVLTELASFFRSLSDLFFRDMRGVPGDVERPGAQLALSV